MRRKKFVGPRLEDESSESPRHYWNPCMANDQIGRLHAHCNPSQIACYIMQRTNIKPLNGDVNKTTLRGIGYVKGSFILMLHPRILN
jgi:hypothetical protein